MTRRPVLLLFSVSIGLGLAFWGSASGQEQTEGPDGTVTGMVTLHLKGDAVPGVRVRAVGLGRESLTDPGGHYAILLPPGTHELRAELVGCAPATWTVRVPVGDAKFDLVLDGPAATGVDPTVLVNPGTGVATNVTGMPYAVDRLDVGRRGGSSGATIADLIRGAVPGVRVVQGSGVPGASFSIVLRGPESISGRQDPLISVDGIVTGGGLDDIDPGDVESIQLLKGSVATATYGARGQAGVIEIRTKRGAPETSARCFLRVRPGT